MTLDKFKLQFLAFLEDSTVNLGRRTTETRRRFLVEAEARFDTFKDDSKQVDEVVEKTPKTPDRFRGTVMRIKPADSKQALNIGKGVHAMTPSESARADEQLNRSPFTNRNVKKG